MAKKPKTYKTEDGYRSREVDKPIMFKLTSDDKAAKADQMACLDRDILKLEADLTAEKNRINGLIAPLERDRRKVSEIVLAGEEERTVKCHMEMDFAAGEVSYRFEGKIVEKRTMEPEEHQQDLALNPGEKRMTRRRRFPGNGSDAADFKKAAAGDKDLPEKEDLASVMKDETSKKTKRSAVDGPTT